MRLTLLTLFSCLWVVVWGQTTFKGGTVNGQDFNNQYYKVVSVPSTASLTVTDASTLNVLDKVMIVQMTGATYNSNGTVANYNSAGNYEIGIICDIQGNTVFLVNRLLRTYDPVNGKVQLVKVQKYASAVVNSLLEATPWDSTRGTGGVLAISVENSLILNSNISADGKGFKGGTFLLSTADCNDFLVANADFYNPTNTTAFRSGSYKGESIANLPLADRGGKAAVASGGGGGNNHNNGGGGGSNLTAGGIGGGNSSTGGCQASNPGRGGYALNSNSNERIFLGGGGGAGHGNFVIQSGGGNGGGILFIEAGSIVGNGNKISANGLGGSNTIGDGASGGGGGGTIILSASSPSNVDVEAIGGKGGDEDESENPPGRCYGEGGGGGGGAIYIKGSQPTGTISVAGGAKGALLSSPCTLNNLAAAGTNGLVIPIANYSQSSVLSTQCTINLPVTLLYFKVTHKDNQATAEWKVETPEDAFQYILQRRDNNNSSWKDIHTIPADDRITTYQKIDGPLAAGIYLYRLKIVEKDRSIHYSPVQQVTIKDEDANRLTVYPNPANSQITIVTPVRAGEWLNIYDMKGRLLYKRKNTTTDPLIKQDISFLPEGVYMIQLGKLTARFVVLK